MNSQADSCQFLSRLASSDTSEKSTVFLDFYEKVVDEVLLPTLPVSTLQRMLESQSPLDIPQDTFLSSHTPVETLKEFKNLLHEELKEEPRLRSKFLAILRSRLETKVSNAEKQKVQTDKSAKRQGAEIPWAEPMVDTFTFRGWNVGVPIDFESSGKVSISDGKGKSLTIAVSKPKNVLTSQMDPKDGSFIFMEKETPFRLFRLLLFDANGEPLKSTEPQVITYTGHIREELVGIARQLILSADSKHLLIKLGNFSIYPGEFTGRNKINFSPPNLPVFGPYSNAPKWVGNSHYIVADGQFGSHTSRVYSLTGDHITSFSTWAHSRVFPSYDGKELYQTEAFAGALPRAQVHRQNPNSAVDKKFTVFQMPVFDLGHKKRIEQDESPSLIDELLSPPHSNFLIQLKYLRDGSYAHEIVVRDSADYRELYRVPTTEKLRAPIPSLSSDGTKVHLFYPSDSKTPTSKTIVYEIE